MSPIGLLKSLALNNGNAQQVMDKVSQAELGNAGKAGSDAGIVKVTDAKSVMPVETADVVIRAMNNFLDGIIFQHVFERRDLLQGYRIDDVNVVASGDLNEAELLGITVAAIGFGIKGYGL